MDLRNFKSCVLLLHFFFCCKIIAWMSYIFLLKRELYYLTGITGRNIKPWEKLLELTNWWSGADFAETLVPLFKSWVTGAPWQSCWIRCRCTRQPRASSGSLCSSSSESWCWGRLWSRRGATSSRRLSATRSSRAARTSATTNPFLSRTCASGSCRSSSSRCRRSSTSAMCSSSCTRMRSWSRRRTGWGMPRRKGATSTHAFTKSRPRSSSTVWRNLGRLRWEEPCFIPTS